MITTGLVSSIRLTSQIEGKTRKTTLNGMPTKPTKTNQNTPIRNTMSVRTRQRSRIKVPKGSFLWRLSNTKIFPVSRKLSKTTPKRPRTKTVGKPIYGGKLTPPVTLTLVAIRNTSLNKPTTTLEDTIPSVLPVRTCAL